MTWQDDLQFYSMHFMPYVHLPPDQQQYESLWVDFSNKHYDPQKGYELYQRILPGNGAGRSAWL